MGAIFFAPVHTGCGAHPVSYTMGTGSLPGVKRLGRGVNHPPQSNAEVKERIELYLCSPSGTSWPVLAWTLLFYFIKVGFKGGILWRRRWTVIQFFLDVACYWMTSSRPFTRMVMLSSSSLTAITQHTMFRNVGYYWRKNTFHTSEDYNPEQHRCENHMSHTALNF